MSNEQRAHDLAILLTGFYLNNPSISSGEFPYISPRKDNLIYDPYCLYKYINCQLLKFLDEDFT